jgi:hypothetical protein
MQSMPLADLTNCCSKLDIEEPGDQDLDETPHENAQKSKTKPIVKFVVDQGNEDLRMAMEPLILDYQRIKTVIQTSWEQYAKGPELDLMTVAATSQPAMQMIRSLVHEFTSLFPGYTLAESIHLECLRRPRIKSHVFTPPPEGQDLEGLLERPRELREVHSYSQFRKPTSTV